MLLWEIYTEGEQPFKGKSNQEIVEDIKMGRLLARPPRTTDNVFVKLAFLTKKAKVFLRMRHSFEAFIANE